MSWTDLGQVTPTMEDMVDMVYPVGSIYMSVNSTSPSTLFGGTWEQLTDTFLYATSTTADASSTTATGGEATHTLTTNEMPSHHHSFLILKQHKTGGTLSSKHRSTWSSSNDSQEWDSQEISDTGGGQAHNNMPPYMKVFMWKRIQ